MTPQEARKLLGGYATGTLTPTEQEALFAAALEDQDLFDELAREQAVRDLLADPAAKASLLAGLDEPRRRWWQSWRPWAAVVAMAGLAALAVSLRKPPAAPVEIARVEPPSPKVVMSAPAEQAPAAVTIPPKRKAVARRAPLSELPVSTNSAPAPKPEPAAPPPATETQAKVEITAASPRLSFQDSAAVRPQSMALRAGAAPLAVRYAILRDGDSVRIRFTAAAPGYLSVGGATPVTMVLGQPYTTPVLTGDEVKVIFARLPVADAPLGLAPDVQERSGETYVTSTAQNEPLVFTISLKQP
jgi:hypothetical protein